MTPFSQDHVRLRTVAQRVTDTCSDDFARSVNELASDFMIVGILKALLMASAKKDDADSSPAALLADWLVLRFGREPTEKTRRVQGCIQWLLEVSDQGLWLMIEQEAGAYLTQLKIYTKAVKVSSSEESQNERTHVDD